MAVGAAFASTLALSACGGGGDKTFSDKRFGITFKYPGNFVTTRKVTFAATAGASATANVAIGLDKRNAISIGKYDLRVSVTTQNVNEVKPQLDRVIGQAAGAALTGKRVTAGGLPGFSYAVPLATASSRVTFLFDGPVEYELNCQATAAKRHTLNRACDRMLATLKKK